MHLNARSTKKCIFQFVEMLFSRMSDVDIANIEEYVMENYSETAKTARLCVFVHVKVFITRQM